MINFFDKDFVDYLQKPRCKKFEASLKHNFSLLLWDLVGAECCWLHHKYRCQIFRKICTLLFKASFDQKSDEDIWLLPCSKSDLNC